MRLAILLFVVFLSLNLKAQVVFKTEYFGSSNYKMSKDGDESLLGDSKGTAMVYQGLALVPLSLKMNKENRPILWSLSLGGAYVNLNNRKFTEDLVIDEILNMSLSLNHIRPLGGKWSMMSSIGFGLYLPGTQFSKIRFRHVLANGAMLFVHHFTPNFELGGGVALNNSLGFPMLFPAIYLNWSKSGRFSFKIAMLNGIELSTKYKVNQFLDLKAGLEMNGQMALFKQNGKEKMFSHQYMTIGLSPEIKITKKITIPLTAGISAVRPAEISNRSLKSVFKTKGYYFDVAPYFSAGLSIGF